MKSFPFDSKITGYDKDGYPIYDRAVDSSMLSNVVQQYAYNGVFQKQDSFRVSASSDLTVSVSPGSAVINGITCIEKVSRSLALQSSDATYDRIDTIVLRLNTDTEVRTIDLYVLTGTPAPNPEAPALTRAGSIYEMGIANVFVPVNSTTLSNERITDTRADNTRCGWVRTVDQEYVDNKTEKYEKDLKTSIIELENKLNEAEKLLNTIYIPKLKYIYFDDYKDDGVEIPIYALTKNFNIYGDTFTIENGTVKVNNKSNSVLKAYIVDPEGDYYTRNSYNKCIYLDDLINSFGDYELYDCYTPTIRGDYPSGSLTPLFSLKYSQENEKNSVHIIEVMSDGTRNELAPLDISSDGDLFLRSILLNIAFNENLQKYVCILDNTDYFVVKGDTRTGSKLFLKMGVSILRNDILPLLLKLKENQ